MISAFNEEESIQYCVNVINDIMSRAEFNYEIVIVDDGSTDNTWCIIQSISLKCPYIKAISFSRNFGKEAAILAGLAYSCGNAVITMDADLQHPPVVILDFIEKWKEENVKIVEGVKNNRGEENILHRCLVNQFYRLMSCAVGKNLSNTSDYKLLDREVVNVILKMPEKQMFYRAITSWTGFKTEIVEYEVQNRIYGRSKWSVLKLMKYAVRNITSFTSAPLQIITACSMFFFALAICMGIISLIKWITGNALEGFTTVILLQLIIGSIIMFALGLIGYYISKLCDEVRDRPRYIIKEKIGYEKKADN